MTDVSQLNRYANIDGRVTYTGIQETETDYISGKSNEKSVYQQILGNDYNKVFNNAGNLILFDYEKIMEYADSEAVSSEDFQHFSEDISDFLIDQAIDDEGNIWLEDLVNYVSPELYSEVEGLDLNQDKKVTASEAQGVSENDTTKIEAQLSLFVEVLLNGDAIKTELSDNDIESLNQIYLEAADQLSTAAFEMFQQELVYLYLQVDLFDFSEDTQKPIVKYE